MKENKELNIDIKNGDFSPPAKSKSAREILRENFERIKENFDIEDFKKWLIEYRNKNNGDLEK